VTTAERGLERELWLDERQRRSCYDQACRLENFAVNIDAERDLLQQGRIESAEYVWRMDVPFTWDEIKAEFLRSHYDRDRGFPIAAVEAAWCVFRLCIESGGLPDWCDVLYWAERSPIAEGMVRAVLCDVDANLTISEETFEERMGPFDDVPESLGTTDWKAEGF
jgi:hypothetical protein